MNLTQLAFRYQRVVFMLLTLLIVYGAYSYFTLPAREDPEITIREATVTTRFPGLSPERMELLITRTLEEYIRRIPEIKKITSSSLTGLSVIHVEIQDRYFDLDTIWTDLRNKVEEAALELPAGTQTPQVNDEFGGVSVITLALTANGYTFGEMFDIAKVVRDRLYQVKGTKKIELYGVQPERIYLETTNARMAQFGVTPNELYNILEAQNIILPGGEIDTGESAFMIEPTGNFESVADIENLLIGIPGVQYSVPLKDLLTVKRAPIDPPFQTAYFNGIPAIMLGISMLSAENVLSYAPRMKAKIEQIQQTLPVGYTLNIATYQADQVAKTVYGVSTSVLQTLAIVLAVVMLFLGIRTGLIVGTIVPVTMLVTLAIMNFTGMTLERMSLATLIISLGLLVDNGIVIAEDFKRRLEQGIDRITALTEGGRELAFPLLTSSLTTILVFMPLMLAEHVAGEYTRSISLVILIALLSSWFLALTVTPILCYHFLKVSSKSSAEETAAESTEQQGWITNGYKNLLIGFLRFRALFVLMIGGVLVAGIIAATYVPEQFFPDSDRTQLLVYTQLPADTSMRTNDQRMQEVFTWLQNKEMFPQIQSFAGYVGFGGPRFVLSLSPEDPADNIGFIVLNVATQAEVGELMQTLREQFPHAFPDMFVRIKRMFLGPSESGKIEVRISGPDRDVLYNRAKLVEAVFRETPGMLDVYNDWQNRVVKIKVNIDQQRARRVGITSRDVASVLQSYFSGNVASDFREDDDIIPIVFRADDQERFNLDRVLTLNVYSSTQNISVPLFQIADFEASNEYARIEHRDLFRTITIEAKHEWLPVADILKAVTPGVEKAMADLPPNHEWLFGGVLEDSNEAQAALMAYVPLCVGLIILLLILQFNSYRKPLIILLTIPLAMVGAFFGLLITQSFMGFMVTLGLYSLAGIIINNAIVLIDRIDIELAAGREPFDAVISACVQRLRPIVMTTITTVLGLLPLILSRDPLFYGMSNAIAFGLGLGTLLTLGFVPVLYSFFYRVKIPRRQRPVEKV